MLFIAKLQQMQFGPSPQKWGRRIDQLELRLEDLESNKTTTAKPSAPVQKSVPVSPACTKAAVAAGPRNHRADDGLEDAAAASPLLYPDFTQGVASPEHP